MDARDEAALVSWLAERDAECPVCGYNLRGLRGARCPECAAGVRLEVGSENLAIGPWVLAVVSVALALGFDGVMAIVMSLGLVLSPPPTGAVRVLTLVVAGFAVLAAACGAGMAALLMRRRAWHRMGRSKQRVTAAATFAGTGLVHAVYGWAVMVMVMR